MFPGLCLPVPPVPSPFLDSFLQMTVLGTPVPGVSWVIKGGAEAVSQKGLECGLGYEVQCSELQAMHEAACTAYLRVKTRIKAQLHVPQIYLTLSGPIYWNCRSKVDCRTNHTEGAQFT